MEPKTAIVVTKWDKDTIARPFSHRFAKEARERLLKKFNPSDVQVIIVKRLGGFKVSSDRRILVIKIRADSQRKHDEIEAQIESELALVTLNELSDELGLNKSENK